MPTTTSRPSIKRSERGHILYPDKLTQVQTFRVGGMGHFSEAGIPGAVAAIADTLKAMNIRQVIAVPLPREIARRLGLLGVSPGANG